jgi:hypothetical protein
MYIEQMGLGTPKTHMTWNVSVTNQNMQSESCVIDMNIVL